jgi:Glycosyltransferase like family 2
VVRDFGSSLHARYMHVPQPNKSNALNAALRELDDCLVFFADDDVRFAPNVLREYARKAEELGPGHFFGGPTGVDYEQEPPAWLKKFLPPSASGWQLEDQSVSETEVWFLGCNWAAFRSSLRSVGDFDIRRGPGGKTGNVGDETEMQVRLRKSGVRSCYLPTAMVWHYVPPANCSPAWALKRAFQNGIPYGLDSPPDFPGRLRYTGWKIRKWASKGARVLRAIPTRNVETLFAAVYEFIFFAGYMYGARLTRQNSPPQSTDSAKRR